MTTPADDPTLLVHAYLDGELDPVHALEIERRMAGDSALATERDRVEALRRVIRERLPSETLPPGLAARVEATIGVKPEPMRARRMPPTWVQPSWRALAASVALVGVLASGGTWFVLRPTQGDAVAEFVVASHMRALLSSQPTDVSSSDRHSVKPWFNGRIPQAPRVVDLTQVGFPLVGGRVDVIGRVPVPTLIYRHRQHLISLFAVPAEHAGADLRRTIAGYNVLSFTENGVTYWAVSDLGIADLAAFASAFRKADPEG